VRFVQQSNAILAALSAGDTAALRPHFRPLYLQQKTVLYEAGDVVKSVYFPINAVISLVVTLATGETTEAAMIGNDGAIGIASALLVGWLVGGGILGFILAVIVAAVLVAVVARMWGPRTVTGRV